MKNAHWSFWLIVGGLGIDLVDVVTTKSGATGGIFYGPTGYLKGIFNTLPGALNPGEAVAMVGAGMLALHHGK